MKRIQSLFKQRVRTGVVKAHRSERYDPYDIRYVATHEAGHAVAAIILGIPLHSVDIKRRRIPEGVSLGFTDAGRLKFDDVAGKGEEVAFPYLVESFAGGFAEAIVNPRSAEALGHRLDVEVAFQIAVAAICRGATGRDGSLEGGREELERSRPRLQALFVSAAEAADELVEEHWPAIERVAALLVRREALSGADVAAVVDAARGLGSRVGGGTEFDRGAEAKHR